jgi:subtilisin family serine protease
LTGLKLDQARVYQDELSVFSRYSHGTHVAGILLAANPYARLVVGGKTFDDNPIKPCPSDERMERMTHADHDYIDFFKAHGVRIVNMSWGGSLKSMEDALEQCGIGRPGDDRKQTSRRWFDIWRKSLEEALRSAPEILFIAAAGNGNSDACFDEGIPASLRMPNLLTVGAVDSAGDETKFTSYGSTVAVHANGYQVESYIPGGGRLRLSGTSMAAPNVANLAAKVLAVNPNLNPSDVIALIRQTADKSDDGRRNLIHPKKAVAAAAK